MSIIGADAPDDEIIRRVLDGDTDRFELLVRRYRQRILRLGYGFFHSQDEAEDFAQDVFLKAYTGLARFRGASSFSTWLTRIAYNTGINAKRRSGRYEALDAEPVDARLPGPEEQHLRAEAVSALRSAIARLPERYAVCVDLYFGEGMKYEDIAGVTGFPVNTIKSHVFRAKRTLRESLDEALGEGDVV